MLSRAVVVLISASVASGFVATVPLSRQLTRVRATAEVDGAKAVLASAASSKKESSDDVVNALLTLEKANRKDESFAKYLDGAWQLVFTTGTVDTQKKTGRLNYVPLVTVVQTFDFEAKRISNGIFLGSLSLVWLFGDFRLEGKKVSFGFDSLWLFGNLKFDLDDKGDDKQGFFLWIDADDQLATARGAGGGLALWKRTDPIPPPPPERRDAK